MKHEKLVTYIEHGGAGVNRPGTIVVHAMAEFLTPAGRSPIHARDFLVESGLSAHVLIEPDGKQLICKPDNEIAWHAKGHNTNSLGIEILVPGEHTYETYLRAIRKSNWSGLGQLDSTADVVAAWRYKYGIGDHMMFRHSDLSPERKVDPGSGFPWIMFRKMVDKKVERMAGGAA